MTNMERDKLGRFKKGYRSSPKTEFRKGNNKGIQTRFKKGHHFSKKTEFRKILSKSENKKRRLIYLREWRRKNKEKIYAQVKARGIKIPKGQICQGCKDKKARIKHHEDYSKPYEVKFLCSSCHNKKIKNRGNFAKKYHKEKNDKRK